MSKRKKNSELTPDEFQARRNHYYLAKYGITALEYDTLLEKQGGVCAICGNPPKTLPLNVDHWHGFAYLRIKFQPVGAGWIAWCPVWQDIGQGQGKLRRDAIKALRLLMLRASIRGLLCIKCNPGLQKFADDPTRLRAAAAYIDKHPKPKELE